MPPKVDVQNECKVVVRNGAYKAQMTAHFFLTINPLYRLHRVVKIVKLTRGAINILLDLDINSITTGSSIFQYYVADYVNPFLNRGFNKYKI